MAPNRPAPEREPALYARIDPDLLRDLREVSQVTGLSVRHIVEALLAKAMGRQHPLSKVVTDALQRKGRAA